jgi:hypothetical protein
MNIGMLFSPKGVRFIKEAVDEKIARMSEDPALLHDDGELANDLALYCAIQSDLGDYLEAAK